VTALRRKLLRDAWRLRGQVLTIAAVIACGIAAFTGALSAHDSLLGLREQHYDSGRFAQVFAPLRRAPLRLLAQLRAIDGVADAEATVTGRAIVSLPGVSEPLSGRVIALPPEGPPRMNRVTVRIGSFPARDDPHGLLVSEAFALHHGLKPGASVQLLLHGKRHDFIVRGIAVSPEFIFAAAGSSLGDESRFGIFWANLDVLEAAYDMAGAFNQVALRVPQAHDVPAVIAATDRLLGPYGGLGAYGREDQASHRVLQQEIDEQRVYGALFPAILLAVALFLLHVMIGRHVATERLQVATLKSLGYGTARIGLHYFGLVLAIVAIGCLAGTLGGAILGHLLTDLYTRYFHFATSGYQLRPLLPLLALLATLGAAALATWNAISAIARLPPAEAMRPPVPLMRARSGLERLAGPAGLSPRIAMGLRDLTQRPLRSAFTVLGMASAVAILVGGSWWGDAFDALLHVEFGLRERADLILSLAEPRGPSVLHEVAGLPGVLQAEGSRDLPIELRNGNRRLRTALVGVDGSAQLHRALDAENRPLYLPPESLAITAIAARRLDVRPGDRLWVQPLEGGEPAREVRVGVLAGNFIGRAAYAPRELANALVGESRAYSTLRLQVASDRRDELLRRLPSLPNVASSGDKARMVADFRNTTARNLLVFTGILSAFAAAISIGIVFNSARVALAERAWEFATLRVLGLTRGEVSALLLWQVGIQVAFALPIGFLLGRGLAGLTAWLIAGDELRIPLVILPTTYAYAAAVTLAAAIGSALVVRRRIDTLDLIAVLKTRD
jgi:putative ABC transport system permease protein